MTQHPDLQRNVSYGDLVVGALQRFPDRVAFRQGDVEWTYLHTADLLARWVTVLREQGLRAGEGVGVLSPNRPEVWLGQSAAGLAGGRYTALHPLGSLDDHLYACNEAELRFLIVDPAFAERAGELEARSDAVEKVFTMGPAGVGDARARDILALAEQAPSSRLGPGPRSGEDVTWLLYTGGTTGVPKAAMLPDRAVVQMVKGVALGWDLPRPMRYLACAPITHAAGCLIMPALLSGGTVTLQRGFDPEAWLRAVPAVNANLGLLVPTMIYAVLDHPALDGTDLSSLETVMYGASPMSPTRMAEALERLGQVFCQLYGQTESGALGTSLWRDDHDRSDLARLATCGKPMPGCRVAILDDDGQPVEDGSPGEICIQGRSVMLGYYKQPELTEETFCHGWLHTGDIAVRDEQGFYTIVDRKKDMIVSGGFNVFPREIEDVLSTHPAVSSAAVIGVPDDKWGEAVKALVILRPDAELDPRELIALVKERKGAIYAPKSVELVDELPLTPVGKPDKKVLRARYWKGERRLVH
ncbi:MAG TPA: AMP-binding protein [Thermoanaerobaculia bacterium]|nr:AMP-binding protein [Thermoanaerobaculia bacterium]